MNHSERDYIILCKQLIEEKFHFENENGTLRQRDLEYLADSIEERSSIKLSLSTLKRLWKKDFDQTPHPSTLEGLVSVLGYKNWQEFKSQRALISSTPFLSKKKNARLFNRWMLFALVPALAVLFWLIAFRFSEPKIKPVVKGTIIFTGNKTVANGVPSTIIFNYDVSNIKADSFFFQQSWDNREKVRIDPKGHYHSNIYYYPDFHRAKLIANDSVVKQFNVHITTDGWMPLFRYSYMDKVPVYLKNIHPISNGSLHVSRNDLLASRVTPDKDYLLSYYNIREFENVSSDNFSLDTKFMCDSNSSVVCPGLQLMIICESSAFFVSIMNKGCETNAAIQMGEIFHDGSKNDLSSFGRDMHQWQHLEVRVVGKKATIYLDEKPVYNITFKNDFGKVVGLSYHFNTTAAVDYVKLKNGENKLVFDDEFDK